MAGEGSGPGDQEPSAVSRRTAGLESGSSVLACLLCSAIGHPTHGPLHGVSFRASDGTREVCFVWACCSCSHRDLEG